MNGIASAGAPALLQVADSSTSSSSTSWNIAMTIDAGPNSAQFGPEPTGITTVKVYDFAGKLIGTYYPEIIGYATTTGTGNASVPMSPCHLSKATFAYNFSWDTFGTPTVPAQSGSGAQTATLTYPAEPTASPTAAPTASPTPNECGDMAQANLQWRTGVLNLNENHAALSADVAAKEWAAAATVLNTLETASTNYVDGLNRFDYAAHEQSPSYAYPQADYDTAITIYDNIGNDVNFLSTHPDNAAHWATAVSDINAMFNVTSENTQRGTEFDKLCS